MKLLKSIFASVLAFTVIFALCGCGNNGDNTSSTQSIVEYSHGVDIISDAENGVIPEVAFPLGYDVEKLKEEFVSTLPEGSEIIGLEESSGVITTQLRGGNVIFCYENLKKDEGISLISVTGDYAYDFSMGGVYTKEDVIDAMGDATYTLLTEEDAELDAFLFPTVPSGVECLTYEVGDYVLKFVFVDSHLSSVTIYNPELWDREQNQ